MNMEKDVLTLNIEDILPNRFQPRIKFKEENINELAESIKEHGVIQPIVVRKISDKYEIIAGERRYKASILAGKTTIPAIVTDLDDKNSAEVALIENVQRQNLTPIEEAISYKKILDMGYINQTDLAEKLGKTQSTIANKLRLLNLDEEVQEALLNEKISERHARSLLKLDRAKQVDMLNRIINERMTVRKTDEEINKLFTGENTIHEENAKITADQTNQEENISNNINIAKTNDQEIEILNFDINEEAESKRQENLEKTMELPIIKEEEVKNNMNNNQFNIPSQPIIENESNDFNSFAEMNVTEIPTNNPNSTSNMNPSDNSSSEIDSQNISLSQNNVEPNSISTIDIASIPDQTNTQILNSEPRDITSNNSMVEMQQGDNDESGTTSGGKFFNMFNINNAENQNYVDDLETKEVNMNFEEPIMQNQSPFNFNFDPMNSNTSNEPVNVEQSHTVNSNSTESPLQMNGNPTPDIFNNSFDDIKSSQDQSPTEDPFQNKLNPYTLNDEEQFTNPSANSNNQVTLDQFVVPPSNSPSSHLQPEMNIQNQPINAPQERFVTGNLKMVINTIRDCASTIEKYGFNIDTEELDFEDSYQVTFKIDKK